MSSTTETEAGSDSGPAFVASTQLSDDTALWLVRHGETEWSRNGRHTGRTDLALTPHGERQAAALREILRDLRPVEVLCSPRARALHTAELAGLVVDAVEPDLAEWDYGDYEGLTTTQIRERLPGWSLWTQPVPGGESAAEVSARADRMLARAASRLADGPVVLVSHGHFCRVLGARWIGLAAVEGGRLALGTAAPCVLGVEHGVPVIERWNMPNPAVEQ